LKTSVIKMAFVFAALLIFIGAGKSFSQAKVAYVDSEVILKQLPESQKIQKDLEALQKVYLDTIGTKEGNLKTMAENFKTKYEDAQKKVESGQIKGEAELKTLNDEIQNLQRDIQTEGEALDVYKQKVQNDLLNRQQELFKPVRDKVTKAIEDVAKEMKYNFVFDKANGSLIYGDKDSDITFKVLDKLK
jgi:outer membrane protein